MNLWYSEYVGTSNTKILNHFVASFHSFQATLLSRIFKVLLWQFRCGDLVFKIQVLVKLILAILLFCCPAIIFPGFYCLLFCFHMSRKIADRVIDYLLGDMKHNLVFSWVCAASSFNICLLIIEEWGTLASATSITFWAS